jgi:ABC-type nitrate/sulfonate/bicarbonate transport system substrate-binding protein
MKITAFPGGGNDMLASLAAGSSDAADLALIYIMRAMDTGIKLKVLMGTGYKGTAIVARSNIQSVADLKGKTIGGTPGGPPFMSGVYALRAAGLDPAKDVNIINIGFAAQSQALLSGQVDAIMTIPEMVASVLRSGSGHVIYTPGPTDPIGQNNSALVVRPDFAEKHPDLVQKLVDAHYRSVEKLQDMQQHDPDGLATLAATLLAGGGMLKDTMRVAVPLTGYRASMKLDQLKDYAQIVFQYGITRKNVANLWSGYLDFSYLAKSAGKPADSFQN